MGCTSSKVDDLPAVALCRERCSFLDEAIRQRYAFADSHLPYLHSLNSLGLSLHRFFHDPSPPSASPIHPHHLHSHSHSDSASSSHLHFHSDDDDDASSSRSPHHHDISSPLHHHPYPYAGYLQGYDTNLPGVGGFININYMKNQTTPSTVYTQQRPMTPQTVHMGDSSSSSYYSNYAYNNHNQNPPYPNYRFNDFPNYAGGGFFAASPPSQPTSSGGFSSAPAVASSSKDPPPPPSPPRSSTWDFLNPFESFDKFYPPYTPSRDSREVREEEGIPELEDDNDDEVVKEVHGDQKFVDSGRSSYSKPEEDGRIKNDVELQYKARQSVGMESDAVEYEVHVVDKKVVDCEERSKNQGNTAGFKASCGFKGDWEVVKEIQVQFERASESGTELAKFLEVGKLQYKRKHGGHHGKH